MGLQFRLWVGDGSFAHVDRLAKQIDTQQAENERMLKRNQDIAVEVDALKNGLDSVEEKARHEMGMIKKGETFYMLVEKPRQR
ncbi:cell division protein FtsB [Marinibactrum halimedae]|uniref:Cell division protein FtsB n=3 Tax=Marinibactrum halimedae TaxID=1444977 RepID=A0AA37WLI8_9GAMM|nr:cell division protein FtsB [Marinibactrum halimedae]